MNHILKKIDAIILVILIVATSLFFYKAGYIDPSPPEEPYPPDPDDGIIPPIEEYFPPTSFIPSHRRDVSSEDEGVHYDRLRISREWWYFSALFTSEDTELKNWGVQVSFNHMTRSDLLGTGKPDLLLITLLSPDGEVYGGITNKERTLGILKQGTLRASSPGVYVAFEDSWAEGRYPRWHVHAEGKDVETNQNFVIDLEYFAHALPIWTFGTRAIDQSESSLANYLFLGCTVNGTITIDDKTYTVSGMGHHEHAWTPNLLARETINGWDWFHIVLDNGYVIYANSFYPTPQFLSAKTSRINPFSTILISSDNGKTFTELKNVNLKITKEDPRIFPFVKMPAAFSLEGKPNFNPLYIVSQSLLYGTNIRLNLHIDATTEYNKVWKFPTYAGMKTSLTAITGTLSWSDNQGSHHLNLDGIGVAWSTRMLL